MLRYSPAVLALVSVLAAPAATQGPPATLPLGEPRVIPWTGPPITTLHGLQAWAPWGRDLLCGVVHHDQSLSHVWLPVAHDMGTLWR